jgi:hypothetical protein
MATKGRLSEIGTHPVTGAHILTTLELSNAGVADAGQLTTYPLVQRVIARNNCLTDLSALGSLAFLTYLDATDNQIGHLESIEICSPPCTTDDQQDSEEVINLSTPRHRAGRGMLPVSQLRELVLARNRISSVASDMSWHTLLTRLDLSGNLLVNLGDVVGALPNLRELVLAFNRVTCLGSHDVLASSQLESLNLDDNGVEDISALSALSNLRSLSVRRNAIASLRGFESALLCELWLADNAIQSAVDIAPLDRCGSLMRLELCGNPLSVTALNGVDAVALDGQGSISPSDDRSSNLIAADSAANAAGSFYRQRVVHRVPHLIELDGVQVSVDDRVNAANFHGADLASRKQSVATKSGPGARFRDYLRQEEDVLAAATALTSSASTRSLLAVEPKSLDVRASSVLDVAVSAVERVVERAVEDLHQVGTQAV